MHRACSLLIARTRLRQCRADDGKIDHIVGLHCDATPPRLIAAIAVSVAQCPSTPCTDLAMLGADTVTAAGMLLVQCRTHTSTVITLTLNYASSMLHSKTAGLAAA